MREMVTLQMKSEKVRAETIYSTRNSDNSIKNRPGVKLPKLPEFREAEDKIDAYLLRFERYGENAWWNLDYYALGLSSLLTGRSLEVYCQLPRDKMNDYARLKQALLVKFSLTEEDVRNTFYNNKQGPGETASQYLAEAAIGDLIYDDSLTAHIFNDYFASAFTREYLEDMPNVQNMFNGESEEMLIDIEIS